MKIADFIVNIIASVVYDVSISKTEKVRFWGKPSFCGRVKFFL